MSELHVPPCCPRLIIKCLIVAIASGSYLCSQTAQRQQAIKKPSDNDSKVLALRFRLENDPHDAGAHKDLVKLLWEKYAFRAELEEDGKWLRNNPNDWMTEIEMRSLAETAVDDPEYAQEVDRFVLSHTKRSDDAKSYDFAETLYAFALLKRKHYKEALDLLQKETTETAEDAGVWENLADAQAQAGAPRDAIVAYRKSIELDPTQEGPHEGLGGAYLKLNDFADAETEYKAAISIYNAQFHNGEPTDSLHQMLKQMQNATHQEPTLAKLHCELAQVYIESKAYPMAIFELESAAQSNSDEKNSYEYLQAHIYSLNDQPDKAKTLRVQVSKEVRDEIGKGPKNNEMDSSLAYPEVMFISTQGDEDNNPYSAQGVIDFYATVPRSTLRAMDMVLLGTAYCKVGNVDQCRGYLDSAFRIDAKLNNARSQHMAAEELFRAQDWQSALRHFQAAYELDPVNTTYRLDFEEAKTKLKAIP